MNDYLLIIDGSSLLSTQFYGNLPREVLMAKTVEDKQKYFHKIMKTSKGVYTNGIYGFIRTLFSILDRQSPKYLAVTWDLTRDTFRRELYEEYKANRSETIEPLKEQFGLCQSILERMGIAQFMDCRYEADDYSGSLAKKFSPETEIRIMTKDHDYLQLVNDRVKLWLIVNDQKKADEYFKKYGLDKSACNVPDKAIFVDEEHVKPEFGVKPGSIASLKGLMGDTADNIKGVPGIGDKTAIPLIAYYESIDRLYDAIHSAQDVKALAAMWKNELGIAKSPINTLIQEKEGELCGEKAARLSEKLATIKTDLDIDRSLSELETKPDYAETVRILEELEFNTIPIPSCISGEVKNDFYNDYKESLVQILDLPTLLENKETVVKLAEKNEIGLALTVSEGELSELAVSVSGKTYSFKTGNFITESVLSELLNELVDKASFVSASDFKSVLSLCDNIDCFFCTSGSGKPEKDFFDLSVSHYLLDPLAVKHDAGSVCSYLGVLLPKIEDETAFSAYTAVQKRTEVLDKLKEKEMIRLYEDIEKPLIPILCDMEKAGIICKPDVLDRQGVQLDEALSVLQKEIYTLTGEEFNILSPKQLGTVLFEKLGLPGGKKTKTGYATGAEVLEKLAEDYPVVQKVLEYRTVSKLKSTYVEGLKECIADDGRIHCRFNQTITATGRLSCTEPNLQNIPVRDEPGRKIRKAFVPKEGCVFVDADYSQIELRIMAHMSGDSRMLEDYRQKKDIHRATAANVFHVPYEEVTKQQRSAAKAVNFGIIYGISSFGLGQDLDIDRKQADEYIKAYYREYPMVKAYMDELVRTARKKEYAETLMGRKRPIPELSSGNFMQRNFGERVAMNMPIQGTAADIMKMAMIRVFNALRRAGLRSRMLLQIHDEILIEAPLEEQEQAQEILVKEMTEAIKLDVELDVESNTADNWYDLK